MSENKSVEPASVPENVADSVISSTEHTSSSLKKSQALSLCAAGLLVCFFLPWSQTILGSVSGFDLQKLDDIQKLLWAIPIFCVITIILGFVGHGQKHAAQITGALPFLVLGYWIYKLGTDVLHILSYGAYLSLLFGLLLFTIGCLTK